MTDKQDIEQHKSQIATILKNGKFCHLSMAVNNEPYVVTINFGYDDEFLYFHSSQKGKKVEMISANPNVCFEVNYGGEIYSNKHACNWGTKFRSIIGFGKAELLLEQKDKENALRTIMHKYSGSSDHEFNANMVSHTSLFRVSLKNVTVKQNKMYW
jgi:uncharacterized protein